ncbi:MAG: MarR family transcriptional regulator [Acuticoccus sp.]
MSDGPAGQRDDGEGEGRADAGLREIGLETFAPYLINRISARYSADMGEALRSRGLTTAKMRALAVLAVHPGLTVNELAVYAVMEQSTMSRTLDALADAGLVERRPREADGRVRECSLTPAGEAAFADVWPLMRRAEARMFAGIDAADRASFMATLGHILRNIRQHDF